MGSSCPCSPVSLLGAVTILFAEGKIAVLANSPCDLSGDRDGYLARNSEGPVLTAPLRPRKVSWTINLPPADPGPWNGKVFGVKDAHATFLVPPIDIPWIRLDRRRGFSFCVTTKGGAGLQSASARSWVVPVGSAAGAPPRIPDAALETTRPRVRNYARLFLSFHYCGEPNNDLACKNVITTANGQRRATCNSC